MSASVSSNSSLHWPLETSQTYHRCWSIGSTGFRDRGSRVEMLIIFVRAVDERLCLVQLEPALAFRNQPDIPQMLVDWKHWIQRSGKPRGNAHYLCAGGR